MSSRYNHKVIEKKWQNIWSEQEVFKSSEDLISRIKQIVDGSNIKTIKHEDGESIIPSIENQPAESSLAKD